MTSQLPDDAITAEARTAFVNFWSAVGPWIAGGHADSEDVAHEAFHAGWQAALPALTAAITAQATTTERERFLSVLAEHYLMMVICDPVKKLDNPVCGCSRVFLGWHPTVGAAHQAYIDHFADVLADVPDGDTNE